MTDAPPRRRLITSKRLQWAFLILCGGGAAYVYEAGAFERAARAEQHRLTGSSSAGYLWPDDVYRPKLQKVRDPRAAEAAMPDEDSVRYFLFDRGDGQVLGQVFHLTLRSGFRRWRRQMTLIYDEYPAPERLSTNYTELPGPPLTREAALAWYDDWQARQRKWQSDNALRLTALKVNLLLLEGTYAERGMWGWSFDTDSADRYDGIRRSIYKFGDAGVEMLVDCLDDAGSTNTRVVRDSVAGEPLRAGMLCHYILRDMVRFNDDPQDDELVVINGERSGDWIGTLRAPADRARLAAAEAAWRARMKRGNYHFERPNGL